MHLWDCAGAQPPLPFYFSSSTYIGLGLGPFGIGYLSDMLTPSLGVESLRYAMVILLPTVNVWSAIHFYLASRTLRKELEMAPE